MNLPVAVRRPLVWLVHAALAAAAYAMAFALRLDGLSLTVDDPRTGVVLFDYGPRFLATPSWALRAGLGDFFVDYYLRLKQAEIDRFNLEVSDWEQREYFSLF